MVPNKQQITLNCNVIKVDRLIDTGKEASRYILVLKRNVLKEAPFESVKKQNLDSEDVLNSSAKVCA